VGTNFPMAGYLRGIKEPVGLISFVLVLSALFFYLGNEISKKFSFKYDKIFNSVILGLAVFLQLLFLLKFFRYINNQLRWMSEVSEKYGVFGFNSFMYGFYISFLTTLVASGIMIWVIVNKKESIST
jgi:hypothetical protein